MCPGSWLAATVAIFPGPLSYLAMPSLPAILILAGLKAIRPMDIKLIWQVGGPPRLVAASTFIATLFLPLQAAVGFGAVLSALIYLHRSSTDVLLVERYMRPDGEFAGRMPARLLPSIAVPVLYVYGHGRDAGPAV